MLQQQGLQLMNPKRGYIGIDPIKEFNPLKLIANVSTPLHIERHGFSFTNDGKYGEWYQDMNFIEQGEFKGKNRLLDLLSEFSNPELAQSPFDRIIDTADYFIENNKIKTILKSLKDKLKDNIINTLSGIGGPKSFYGLGMTNFHKNKSGLIDIENKNSNAYEYTYLNRLVDTTHGSVLEDKRNIRYDNQNIKGDDTLNNSDNTYTNKLVNNTTHGSVLSDTRTTLYDDNKEQPGFNSSSNNTMDTQTLGSLNTYQSIKGFSEVTQFVNFDNNRLNKQIEYFDGINGYPEKYKYDENGKSYFQNWNMAKRLGITDNSYIDELNPDHSSGTDTINMGSNTSEDLIKIKIGGIQFRAFVTGLSDTFSPNWSPTKYIGRPDEVYTYEGVKRSLSFSLLVVLFSARELDAVYIKLNQLAQFTAPIVSDTGQMTGQIIDLKYGMWFATNASIGLPVILTSLSYTVDDNFTWDVIREKPMAVNISLGFDVIDNYSPSSTKKYFGGTNA